MIGSTDMLPPSDPNSGSRFFNESIRAIADPQAALERLQKLEAAQSSAEAAIAKAQRDSEAAAKAVAEARATIAREQSEHAARIVAERATHNDAMAHGRREIEALHRSAVEHDRQASTARAEAEKPRAEMSRRLAVLEGRA